MTSKNELELSKAYRLPAHGFVRLPTVLQLIPVGRSTLWEMIARGDFPPPVKLSARVSAWSSEAVFAFMASRTTAYHLRGAKADIQAQLFSDCRGA